MKVCLRRIEGIWEEGWVLDKHTANSTYIGDNAYGHPQFDTVRTEVGEATFLLKYRSRWDQVNPLAQAIADNICRRLPNLGFIVPMPASRARTKQPVTEVANALGQIIGIPVFENILVRIPASVSIKDLSSKDEKIAALAGQLILNDDITNQGKWNVLVVDDLFDSGASMEAACRVLRTYPKVASVYVAALTWK